MKNYDIETFHLLRSEIKKAEKLANKMSGKNDCRVSAVFCSGMDCMGFVKCQLEILSNNMTEREDDRTLHVFMGGHASGFALPPKSVSLTVGTRAFSSSDVKDFANRLHEVGEADIRAETPGRLYIGDQYLTCYIGVASSVEQHSVHFITKKVTVLIEEPFWCTEVTTVFNVSQETDATGKRFDLRYPYRYGSGLSNKMLMNNFFASCPAIIEVYGATENPSIYIDGNLYNVDVQIPATARLVINQVTRKIYIVDSYGKKTSCFNARNKESDVFQGIKPGCSTVSYSGDFRFAITLVQQRSEPRWI